jgi:predicted  nucleic acid-binding Zn-ribbon protein
MNSLASAVVEHVERMVDRRLAAAEERAAATYREAVELVQTTADKLVRCDAERAELKAKRRRLIEREAELEAEREKCAQARRAYEQARAELVARLAGRAPQSI